MSMNSVIFYSGDDEPGISMYPYGTAMEGGYFYGVVVIDGVRWGLVMSPASVAIRNLKIKTTNATDGALADSTIDGWANTNNLNDALHPVYQRVRSASISGYTDWYIPAIHELEPFYRNLKPYSNPNTLNDSGTINGGNPKINPWTEPPGVPYTADTPAQTTVNEFKSGQSEHIAASIVSSTTLQSNAAANYTQRHDTISYGGISSATKNYTSSTLIARPIRKFRMP